MTLLPGDLLPGWTWFGCAGKFGRFCMVPAEQSVANTKAIKQLLRFHHRPFEQMTNTVMNESQQQCQYQCQGYIIICGWGFFYENENRKEKHEISLVILQLHIYKSIVNAHLF